MLMRLSLSLFFLAVFAWPEVERTRAIWDGIASTLALALGTHP
jgi:hypothetical protein